MQKIKNKPLGRKQILFLVQFAMLLAIEAVFCFTPLGSLTNTFLVLGGAYLFFGPEYAAAAGMGYELLLGALGLIILTNGIPEMIISILAAEGICRPLKKQLRHWSV